MAQTTDTEKKSIELPWATIIASLVAIGGVFLYLNPIRTARPNERAGFHSDLDQPEDVEARLWQDALRAATEHENNVQWKLKDASPEQLRKEEEQHSDSDLAGRLHRTFIQEPTPGCWVLAVMIPGNAYAEFAEQRLRILHAVLEGLGSDGYVPQDGEHIGYVKVNERAWQWQNMIVPYEWCKRDVLSEENKDQPNNVCIVWLRDEEFRRSPLTQLDCLLCHLGLCGSENAVARPKVRIIGPYSSATLRKMMEEIGESENGRLAGPTAAATSKSEASVLTNLEMGSPTATDHDEGIRERIMEEIVEPDKKATCTPKESVLADVEMWSPTATVDDEVMLKGIKGFERYSKVEQVFSAESDKTDSRFRSFSFKRATRTDRELMQTVVAELQNNRGLSVYENGKPELDRIVLIAEWDTLFGRALPRSAIDVIRDLQNATSKPCSDTSAITDQCVEKNNPSNVLTFSYLRGIDGALPGAADTNEASSKSDKPKAPIGYESTEGLNQADYLRRLSTELVAADNCLHKKNSRIGAIGVLGGDVYDKLLVLQALRRTFPDVIFFTNNLDARLAHPDQWHWTRNLLVASPFALTLKHEVQRVPPFRDNNQTAIYMATHLIGKGMHAKDFNIESLGPPRLYEIGRYGAFDLTGNVKEKSLQPSSPDTQRWWTLARSKTAICIVAIVILGLIWLSCVILGRRSDSLKHLLCSSWVMFVLLGITSLIVVWLISVLISLFGKSAGDEPYSWTDGVSVWPTDTLRLLACLLSVFYMVKTFFALRDNQRQLEQQFGLGSCYREPTSSVPKAKFRNRAREWLGALSLTWQPAIVSGVVDGPALWQCYVRSGREGVRFARILPLVICYFVAGAFFFDLLHPPRSLARGSAVPWDFWLGRGSAFALVLLTFYVADATLLNRRLIDHLKGPIKWPQQAFDSLRTRFSKDPKIPPDDLLMDYLNIDLIAIRTEVVGGLIYYPFVITSLLILSRASIFDNWTWSTPLLLLIVITAAIAAFSASYLRWTAEDARRKALQRLRDGLIGQIAIGKGQRQKAQVIRETSDLISAERRGAFGAISQRPLVRALLLPSGSAGIWALFQYFPRLLAG